MNQLTQQLKSGRMEILEVPFPVLGNGQVLVRNHYSVISTGTESKTVSDARKGYIAKAKSRRKEVKMVIDLIKSEGFHKTYDLVMNKLDVPSALGYSCAGEVIAVGPDITGLKVGDKVACGGNTAVHADVVAVSRNLCVKVPENVSLKHAAFSTIAAIAIQGIRQADLRIGENCTVIGLGVIGLITLQILKAAGIKAIAIDINQAQVELAKKTGADLTLIRDQEGLVQTINDFTGGYGTDAVIITASTSSNDPVELAGELCRKKGKVVIVGAVPTGFSRTHYYRKELDLRMSSSYGPGRYDTSYEEKNIDYPIGYVRFTENRNMQTFIDLLASQSLDMDLMISHAFPLEKAPEAYDLILERKEQISGIVIEYNSELKPDSQVRLYSHKVSENNATCLGFIGAGNFTQNYVLPQLKGKCSFVGIVTAEGNISRYLANKYHFSYCAESADTLLNDSNIGTIFIMTRHNTHAEYITKALEAGKNVVVEKPLAMNLEELEMVKEAYLKSGKGLMLGFNRRFGTLPQKMMTLLTPDQKKAINIRINAGVVPPDHWVHDPEIGGGRIIGEVCHFIDLACYIAGSKAKRICTSVLSVNPQLEDTVSINLDFENGSIANISYYSNGNKNVPKERIEVFCNGTVCLIEDFKRMKIINGKGIRNIKLKGQDKGHSRQFELVIEALKSGGNFPITFEEIYHSSLLTLEALRSVREGRVIEVSG
jgi:polar amino acid transport system substrate-binding protein